MTGPISTIKKNSIDEIRIQWTEYRGHTYLDVRVHTLFDGEPEPKPTKKGITLKPDQISELIEALSRAQATSHGS